MRCARRRVKDGFDQLLLFSGKEWRPCTIAPSEGFHSPFTSPPNLGVGQRAVESRQSVGSSSRRAETLESVRPSYLTRHYGAATCTTRISGQTSTPKQTGSCDKGIRSLTEDEVAVLNRKLIESAFRRMVRPHPGLAFETYYSVWLRPTARDRG